MSKPHGRILGSKPIALEIWRLFEQKCVFINHKQLKLLGLLSPVVVQKWIRIRPKKTNCATTTKSMHHSARTMKMQQKKATTSRYVALTHPVSSVWTPVSFFSIMFLWQKMVGRGILILQLFHLILRAESLRTRSLFAGPSCRLSQNI